MARYSNLFIDRTLTSPPRYTNIKYPEILPGPNDIYLRIAQGDRYDILAHKYYSDSSLWWIIQIANPNHPSDSIIPPYGSQIRIPSADRIPSIIAQYESLNT